MKTNANSNQRNGRLSKVFTKTHMALAVWYIAVVVLAAHLAISHVNNLMQQLN